MATMADKEQELWEKLCGCEVGSDEWQTTYDALEKLEEFDRKSTDFTLKIRNEERKLQLEERKIENDLKVEEGRNKNERRSIVAKFIIGILGLGATAGVAVCTVKDEEFRAITSKVDQKAKDCLRFIKF